MSHFTTLVIGDNPRRLLEPYEEFQGTEPGKYEEFVSEFTMEEAIEKFKGNEEHFSTVFEFMAEESYEFQKETNSFGYWANPNAKWDWYQLGGRWSGYFKLKGSDEWVDECLKEEIDLEYMTNKLIKEYTLRYKFIHSQFLNELTSDEIIENIKNFKTWGDCRDEFEDLREAREAYHNQVLSKIFDNAIRLDTDIDYGLFGDVESYFTSLEKYIEDGKLEVITPFAYLSEDNGWVEKGEMGWFGSFSEGEDIQNWNRNFMEYFSKLPGDTEIALYNLHI